MGQIEMADFVRWGERIFLVLLAGGVIVRLLPQIPLHPYLVLFLVSELVGVVMILTQRRGEWATRFYPVAVAFFGTSAGLMVVPEGIELAPDSVSLSLVIAGGAVSLAAKLFLGRSFGLVAANRGVKQGGIYRFVRHPMYLGYMLNQLGFLLLFFGPWNLAVYAAAWCAFWLRAIEEEKFLNQDPAYREYAQKVRFRLVPGVA